ncbi:MAG: polysaccharide pyruvyl transferase family protein [Nodosilinea sp.]
MRILFTGIPEDSRFSYDGWLCGAAGLSRKKSNRVSDLLDNHRLAGNTGNALIGEGATRMLDCDRSHSVYLSLARLHARSKDIKEYQSTLNKFDSIVLSCANMLRSNYDVGMSLVEALENAQIPIYVFGLGIQQPLNQAQQKAIQLHPNTARCLAVLNEKARIFGTRGYTTSSALAELGYKNSIPLGCPSFFLYPENFLLIEPTHRLTRLATGGYLGKKDAKEFKTIQKIASAQVDLSYVFQDEIKNYGMDAAFRNQLNDYSDAWGELNSDKINWHLQTLYGSQLENTKYFLFFSPSQWRTFNSFMDGYIGCRIHGALSMLQVAKPAVVVYPDLRVKEFADFFALPSIPMQQILAQDIQSSLEIFGDQPTIEKFKDTYRVRHQNLADQLSQYGLKLKM